MNKNYEKNREQLYTYFQSSCKDCATRPMYGLEMERFLVDKKSRVTIPYYGEDGVEGFLRELSEGFTEMTHSEGHLIGMGRSDLAVTIEPAAQFEISISPQNSIDGIEAIYERFTKETEPVLKRRGLELVSYGYQPKSRIADLPIIPKDRYRFMHQYFESLKGLGPNMMKGTASVQLSLDFYSEEHLSEQYFAAYTLLPLLAFLTENTPVFEGRAFKKHLLRMKIWKETDPARVVVGPFLADHRMNFERYLDFLVQAPIVVKETEKGDVFSAQTIGEVMEEKVFDRHGLNHLLSMVFPMIRIKNFMEVRIADSLPFPETKVYMLLLKGLFSNLHETADFAEELADHHPDWYETILSKIEKAGADTPILDGDLRRAVLRLFAIAEHGLSVKEHRDLNAALPTVEEHGKLIP